MHKSGHYGVNMIVASPLFVLFNIFDAILASFVFLSFTVFFAPLPDFDIKVSVIKHRGITHTVWFAVLFGVFCSVVTLVFLSPVYVYLASRKVPFIVYVLCGGLGGFLSICSHIIGDSLTPMGVKPFGTGKYNLPIPYSHETSYSFEITKAANDTANFYLWFGGVATLFVALLLGSSVSVGV